MKPINESSLNEINRRIRGIVNVPVKYTHFYLQCCIGELANSCH